MIESRLAHKKEARAAWQSLLLAVSLSAMAFACGTSEEAAPPFASMGGQLGFGGALIGGCNENATTERRCAVYITQANGITSCFSGIQFCDEGTWSECFDESRDPRVE